MIEQFNYSTSELGVSFVLGSGQLGEVINPNSLQTIAPSYLYQQYADDSDLQAFVAAYNGIVQGYLDQMNNAPLGLYTSGNISGLLLDWIAQGIYGIDRPYLSQLVTRTYGALGTYGIGTKAIGSFLISQTGTSQAVTDDIYKRVMTWYLYRGDGYKMSIQWLKRRVARFLYGANGGDIDVNEIYNVNITQTELHYNNGGLGTYGIGTKAIGSLTQEHKLINHAITIQVPSSNIGQVFQSLIANNYLALPFQVKFTVIL